MIRGLKMKFNYRYGFVHPRTTEATPPLLVLQIQRDIHPPHGCFHNDQPLVAPSALLVSLIFSSSPAQTSQSEREQKDCTYIMSKWISFKNRKDLNDLTHWISNRSRLSFCCSLILWFCFIEYEVYNFSIWSEKDIGFLVPVVLQETLIVRNVYLVI